MTRMLGRTLVLMLACAIVSAAMPRTAQSQGAMQQAAGRATVGSMAAQLGIKVESQDSDELDMGSSVTGVLKDPAKLAALGIGGMHEGARVTIARIGPDRVRVEADEMEPVAHNGAADLRITPKGELAKLLK